MFTWGKHKAIVAAAFAAGAASAARLATVPTVTAAERDRILNRFNDTGNEVPQTTLDALVREACRQFATRPALSFGAETLTYAQLDADVERLREADRGRHRRHRDRPVSAVGHTAIDTASPPLACARPAASAAARIRSS